MQAIKVFAGTEPTQVQREVQVAIRSDGAVFKRSWELATSWSGATSYGFQWTPWKPTGQVVDPSSIPSDFCSHLQPDSEAKVRLPSTAYVAVTG
jgi:hypothetical protein